MTSIPLLDTSPRNLSEIFSNGKIYRIPPFQRDYSWKEENWEELWEDIIALDKASRPHYLGSIVLQARENDSIVIDGQQRLATLSILTIAVLRIIDELANKGADPEQNKERYSILFNQYIGAKDPASLKYSSKLFLNETDDSFYQQNLVNFRPPLNAKALKESQQRLWNAYKFFNEKVAEKFSGRMDGKTLAEFIDDIVSKKLLFIQIMVQDEVSAYTVFETLNARGLGLTSTDLLKNFLFSKMAGSSTDLAHIGGQWRKIIDIVGTRDFPEFLRHHLNSFQPYVRAERLFRALKDKVTVREDAFALLDELEKSAYWYKAFSNPHDDLWRDHPGCGECVRPLVLFKVTQYKPLMLAASRKFAGEELKRILRACLVVSFRFNVICQKSTHQLEQTYNQVALNLSNGTYTTVGETIKGLNPIYIGDEEFINAFETVGGLTQRKQKLARFILSRIENQLSNSGLDFETSPFSIEHILPENPGEGWESFTDEDRERFTYRLGNLTILEPPLNKEIGNRDYAIKSEAYASSKYALTKKITSPEWTSVSIIQRQREMAGWASAVWRLEI